MEAADVLHAVRQPDPWTVNRRRFEPDLVRRTVPLYVADVAFALATLNLNDED